MALSDRISFREVYAVELLLSIEHMHMSLSRQFEFLKPFCAGDVEELVNYQGAVLHVPTIIDILNKMREVLIVRHTSAILLR